jgi:hypothetical protein
VSIVTLYFTGDVQLSVKPFSVWRECVSADEARSLATRHGFVNGDPTWPRREIDFSDPSLWSQMAELLEHISGRIAAEERRLADEQGEGQE